MKERYLDLMERAVGAYSGEQIAAYTENVRKNGLREHGYPRLTANIGILLAHGRGTERMRIFPDMMELCCREILTARQRTEAAGNDFSVKEIVCCLEEAERAALFPKSVTDGWRGLLGQIDPYRVYTCIAPVPARPVGNWAAFAAASEQIRIAAGIGNERAFVENQILSQLFSFDENGMYRDPNEPMVYDFVTRLQLALALDAGYDGEGRDRLEDFLDRSAYPTLFMQSVSGEIPFGGRSNQFLHNETFYAALCEFYASRYARRGDQNLAGQFRCAARLAAQSLDFWLSRDPVGHIKNRFPAESRFGCEGYGYFEKYMVTMGSWAYLAYRFADDAIGEVPCPSVRNGYVFETSPTFHKVFLSAADYFAEFDTDADPHYDASGLGRIHRRGAPSVLALSVPFAEHPSYEIPDPNPGPLSVSVGTEKEGKRLFSSAPGTAYTRVPEDTAESPERAETSFRIRLTDGTVLSEHASVGGDGILLTGKGEGKMLLEFPVFLTDGESETELRADAKRVSVSFRGWKAVYSSDGIISDTGETYANRNGLYRRMIAEGEGTVRLRIEIVPE